MNRASLVFALLSIMIVMQASTSANQPSEIIIDSSNNHVIDDQFFYLPLPISLKKQEVNLLRDYVFGQIQPRTASDIQAFGDILSWVHTRWKHDGKLSPGTMSTLAILQAAESGRSFSCIEYSKVFADILHSFGYVCRVIGVTDSNIAYGGMGVSHTLCEAWSDELNKWIVIDPQFGYMIQRNGQYINYHELYKSVQSNNYQDVHIEYHEQGMTGKSVSEQLRQQYLAFIKRYFSFIMFDMKVNSKDVMYVLPLGKHSQFLTSQGGNSKPLIFLQSVSQAYFNVNRTHLLFEFNIPSGDVSSIVGNEQVHSQEEYKQIISTQLAIPDFTVHLTNNAPWFSSYEMRLNGEQSWKKIDGHSFQLKLREGINAILVRTVNQAGRTGVITKMSLRYQ